MEYSAPGSVSEAYMSLLPCLLVPILWERPANISPLVRLLNAYSTVLAPAVVAQEKLVIFQKFIPIWRKIPGRNAFKFLQEI